jgi:rubrerythrin
VNNQTATIERLQEIVRRESLSVLQYVRDAFPWTTIEEQEALVPLQKLIAEERQATARLANYLLRTRHQLPYVGSYPMQYTSINFIALEHLLPLLAEEERKSLEQLEQDEQALTDPEVRALIHDFVEIKERHLRMLKSLVTTYPETHSTVR